MRIGILIVLLALGGCVATNHRVEIIDAYKAGMAAGFKLAGDWCGVSPGVPVRAAGPVRGEWKMYMTYTSLADHRIHKVPVCQAMGVHCTLYATREACNTLAFPPYGLGTDIPGVRAWVRGAGGDISDGFMVTCSTDSIGVQPGEP